MDFPRHWKLEENRFDQNHAVKPKENNIASPTEFCLSDFLIIQKWIDYAKGLNDPSSQWFKDRPIIYGDIYNLAVQRRSKFGNIF